MTSQHDLDTNDQLISADALARRWDMSRSGAIRILERAGVTSVYIGGTKRGARRFRLRDVLEHERRSETWQRPDLPQKNHETEGSA